MTTSVPEQALRDRIRDLNTKAYYLLVALSFVYRATAQGAWLKWAFVLTAIVAVLPVQDYVKSPRILEALRFGKVLLLTGALVCTIVWVKVA